MGSGKFVPGPSRAMSPSIVNFTDLLGNQRVVLRSPGAGWGALHFLFILDPFPLPLALLCAGMSHGCRPLAQTLQRVLARLPVGLPRPRPLSSQPLSRLLPRRPSEQQNQTSAWPSGQCRFQEKIGTAWRFLGKATAHLARARGRLGILMPPLLGGRQD